MATQKRRQPHQGAKPAARPATKATAATGTRAGTSKGRQTTQPAGPVDPKSASKRLFDLRWLIAAMFAVYGVVLIVTGIFDDAAEVAKAAGVRINLWTGIGMFLTAVVFAVWAKLRPLRDE